MDSRDGCRAEVRVSEGVRGQPPNLHAVNSSESSLGTNLKMKGPDMWSSQEAIPGLFLLAWVCSLVLGLVQE